MNIRSAEFIAGITDDSELLRDATPKIAFIGRSNVGKSSLINTLTGHGVARVSAKPGHTRQINVYLINKNTHLVDLPGYGFASGSLTSREKMGDLIHSYLFNPEYEQQMIVLIIDAVVGMTDKDKSMFMELVHFPKNFLIAVSKIDKLNQADYHRNLTEIKKIAGAHRVFPFSSKTKKGLNELAEELFA